MSTSMLEDFLEEEGLENVRELLLRAMSDCGTDVELEQQVFEFNRFQVTVDCASRSLKLEDDLNPELDGEEVVPFEDAQQRLWQR